MLFFEQTVLQGQIGHGLLQGRSLSAEILHLARRRRTRNVSSSGACRPRGPPWTSNNTLRRRCPRAGTVRRCSPRPAGLQAQYGSSLPPNNAGGSAAECPLELVLPVLCPVRVSVSSSLLVATMNQKSSLRKILQFVSQALTANTLVLRRHSAQVVDDWTSSERVDTWQRHPE